MGAAIHSSVLPDISPSRGEIGSFGAARKIHTSRREP